nr:hypothetical protein [Tanacetum cinerariifolium]
MEQVKRSERLNDAVMKYQALKRKPLTEAQARKSMIIYLKNMAGFKMNYFKGMTYSEIRPLFEKHYNYNQAFLVEVNEEVTLPEKGVEVEAHKREGESLEKENFDREDLESLWKLVKERYPLTHFTLEKMMSNVRLEVEEESEMSLKLLRLVRRQLNEGDLMLRLCHKVIAYSIAERSLAPKKRLQGLTVIAPDLSVIDIAELARLQIYNRINDTWAWVASGPERQPNAATHFPEPPPVAELARTLPQRVARQEEVHRIREALGNKKGPLPKEAAGTQTSHSKKKKKFIMTQDNNPSQTSGSTLVVVKMCKEVQQAANVQTSLGGTASTILHSEFASRHDALEDFTTEVDHGKSDPKDSLSQKQTHFIRKCGVLCRELNVEVKYDALMRKYGALQPAIEMDSNTSIGRLCLGKNNQGFVAEGIENKEQMEEEGERYFTPCYVGGLHAYDGEINLKYEKNLISNYFAVKLCLEYEEKYEEKLVKREVLVSLKREFYFVKVIVNPEEDDVEPSVILDRWFMRLTKGIAYFGNGIIKIHPELDPFLDNSEETKKFEDDWDHLLDIDFGDMPEIDKVALPPFKEAAREALAIDICKRFSILKEERPVIKTLAYSDKYKKILDRIVMDKLKVDGEIKKEEEEAIKQVKEEALKEKEDHEAFVIPIQLEAKSNLNALADTDSDINAEHVGVLKDVMYKVGDTTITAKFLILDMPIDKDAPILVGRAFLYTCGSILNTRDRITSTFYGVYHQIFRAAKTSLNTKESDSDDEEDYGIQRNNFESPIYGPKPAKYLNCNDLMDRALALLEILSPFRKIYVWKKAVGFLGSFPGPLQHMEWKPDYKENFGSDEVLFTSEAWKRAFDINEPIYTKLCHEFYATFEFDEAVADDELMTKKAIKFRLCGKAYAMSILDFAKRLGQIPTADAIDHKHKET